MKHLFAVTLTALLLMSGTPVHAANVPVLDSSFHIVPDAHDLDPLCPVGAPLSYGAVLDTIQRGMNAAISFGVLIFVMLMAWAGLQFIMSVTNPEARSHARGMLLNAAVGLLIVLSAWLIVDFVMKSLYSGSGGDAGAFGPWNSILNGGSACIIARETSSLVSGNIIVTIPQGGGGVTGGVGTYDGFFTYDPGVAAQKKHMSETLASMLTCMATHVPAGVGRISSISDSKIVSGGKTFEQCVTNGGCSHGKNSCHYGGRKCTGSSYAVDFGDGDPQHPENLRLLKAAASACGALFMTDNEEGKQTHLHVSIGSCGCDGH